MHEREGICKVELNSEAIKFRGDIKGEIRLADVHYVGAEGGVLTVDSYRFEVGSAAPKWVEKIKNPPTLLTKLGLKPGMRLAAIGFSSTDFLEGNQHENALVPESLFDVILLRARHTADLRQFRRVKDHLAPRGMLWIVYPKGVREITQGHVFAAGHAAQLVDVKVCRFTEELTAIKFLRRKAEG